jgi:alkylation response protein AidB-like acyl-CoA dehydrogenase
MDFSFTDEQKLLADTLSRFVSKEYGFEKRKAILAQPEGFSREVWRALADMGILGLPFAEAYGGIGGSAVDTMIVMNAIGAGLVVEPYLSTVVLAGGLIDELGSEAQKKSLLPAIAEGRLVLAFAHGEPQARYEPRAVATQAKRSGSRWAINGEKAVVAHGGQADRLVVSARTSGAEGDARGISLFLVERAAKGVVVRDYRTIDGLRAAEIQFFGAAGELLGGEGRAFDAIERVTDAGIAALCAEAVGAMETVNAQTLDYIKARQQFGQPIGRFQVLQHRAVDMMIHCEQSKSMAFLAAMRAQSADAAERRRAASAAKVHIGRSGRFVAQSAIQLHGGMGMTDELAASHYAKRLTMINFHLGDVEHHLDRFIREGAA